LLACTAGAQPYPVKPVRVIVNFPPGAGTDISTRLVTAKLTEMWGQQFLVDNRPGATGNIGVELAARAAPDGYTLLTATAAAAISQTLFSKIGFDAGIDLLHVPYKGMVAAITDVIGSNVSIIFGNTLVVLPNMRSGRVRGLGITSVKRSGMAPDLPTIAESGFPGFESGTWYGMMAPARTPRDMITRLSGAVMRIVRLADVREKLIAQGAEPLTGTPAQMGEFVRSEIARWGKVAKAAGIRVE